ncbi:uncharacterized protein [Littorina saxatilis]|uniref:Uncharacterized protein n=1 Tax=Littorina saxatilis TaxID=31220 RepID=A0AAN9BHZ7_9CAEN
MGVNESKIYNDTGDTVCITTYNYSDTAYWIYRDARQVPDNGTPITVDGLAGGKAIKVAVIYNKFVDGEQFVCDLFSVEDGCSLTIKGLTKGAGVTAYSGRGVERLANGMVISLNGDLGKTFGNLLDMALTAGLSKIIPAIDLLDLFL